MPSRKIKTRPQLQAIVARLRSQGKKVVFTNGCFDILHAGHIRYLRKAKSKGDDLLVGLNTEHSVRLIKGGKRPIIPQKERAEIMAALEFVDYVVLFNEPNPLRLIETLKPDILLKGADWPKDQIIGQEAVEKGGGRVLQIPLVPGASTSGIIDKILKVYSGRKSPGQSRR